MLDDDTRELISDYYLMGDDDIIDLTYGRQVRSEYFCEGETYTVEVTDSTGAIGALTTVLSSLAKYTIDDKAFEHDELPYHVVAAISAAASVVHDVVNALVIRDPSAILVGDDETGDGPRLVE